jgi:ribosomal protein S18 acetylase RimI-like enzyme
MNSLAAALRHELCLRPHEDVALSGYVLLFQGTARMWDEEQGGARRAGEIRGYRLDLMAARYEGFDQSTLLRRVSPEIAEFTETVLGASGCLLPPSGDDDLERVRCDGIVYISQLEVAKDLRGRGIGSGLLRRLGSMIDLTGCLVALKAAPLASDYDAPVTPAEMEQVQNFYRRQGFQPGGGGFMVKDARLCDVLRKRLLGRAQGQKS